MRVTNSRSPGTISIIWPSSGPEYDVDELRLADLNWSTDGNSSGQTLVIWDADAPNGPLLHWAVTHIHDGHLEPRDHIITTYLAPNPPEGETHRYYIWVFDENLPSRNLQDRHTFSFDSHSPIATVTILGTKRHGRITLRESNQIDPPRAVAY
jgi:hypothetical protein